jgi:hypothetical protein
MNPSIAPAVAPASREAPGVSWTFESADQDRNLLLNSRTFLTFLADLDMAQARHSVVGGQRSSDGHDKGVR